MQDFLLLGRLFLNTFKEFKISKKKLLKYNCPHINNFLYVRLKL